VGQDTHRLVPVPEVALVLVAVGPAVVPREDLDTGDAV
jgi:hypothetical protein